MRWLLLCLLACHRPPLDPLAAQRVALSELLAEQPAPGWSPHATVSLSSELLNRALAVDISSGINQQMEPSERDVLGMKVLIRPSSQVERFVVSSTDTCESCLEVSLTLVGKHDLDLTASSGTTTLSQGWTAEVRSIIHVAVRVNKRGKKVLTASLAAAEDWRVTLSLANLPDSWNMLLGTLLHNEVQRLVGRPDIPAIPVLKLEEDGPVPLRDLRVRTLGDGAVALDLNLGILASGGAVVTEGPATGWGVDMASDTVLGLMQAAALVAPIEEDPMAIFPMAVAVDAGQFELELRALSTKKEGRFKEFSITGELGVDDGVIRIEATNAVLSGTSTKNPDILTLLLKKKILQMVADALTLTVPAVHTEALGENAVTVELSGIGGSNGQVSLTGDMDFGAVLSP
jgi:hypothetical protein